MTSLLSRLWYSLRYYGAILPLTLWHGSIAIGAGLLGVAWRRGGIYDRTQHHWARRLIRAAGTPVTLVGFERVPRDRPVVYVSNHQSWFDILALAGTIPGTLRFVAKKEMAAIPLLGRAMKAAGHIYIDRQNRAQAIEAYEEVAAWIRNGLSTVVFPEGTRSRTGRLLPFKKGPFVLALAAQVPVVPVYVSNTFLILPKAHLLLRPRRITIYFDEPIPTAGMSYEQREVLLQRSHAAILRMRAGTGDAVFDADPPQPPVTGGRGG
jgi:1-acyl-sn-glycerol-3-phosphate acyltransferase